jgi:hypothetical protein
MLLESVGRLFEDHCTRLSPTAPETGAFLDALWQAVSDTGVPLAALPSVRRRRMPSGRTVRRCCVAGRYSAPIPLAETMLAWVASSAGLEVSEKPMTVGLVRGDDRLTLERDGNGWRLIRPRQPAAVGDRCRTDRAARRCAGWCDGSGSMAPPARNWRQGATWLVSRATR